MNGTARLVKDMAAAYQRMRQLVVAHDPHWNFDLSDKDRSEMMAEIVVFEIEVQSINAKFKMSQNQVEINRSNVIKELSLSPNQTDRETSEIMAKT